MSKKDFHFHGFSAPRYTQVPDEVMDVLMPELSESELKVLLYIVRRTFGFGKDADAISLNQMIDGITTRDGRVLDRGTGLSRSSVRRGIAGLEEKGVIVIRKIRSEEGDFETNVYALRFRENQSEQRVVPKENHPAQGVVPEENYPGFKLTPPVVPNQNLQEIEQETDAKDRSFEASNGPSRRINYSETRTILQPYLEDFAREFADQAKLPSTLTRAVNICERSGLDVDEFIDVMMAARAKTKEYSGSVKAEMVGEGWSQKRPRMAYFFAILEQMVGLRPERQTG